MNVQMWNSQVRTPLLNIFIVISNCLTNVLFALIILLVKLNRVWELIKKRNRTSIIFRKSNHLSFWKKISSFQYQHFQALMTYESTWEKSTILSLINLVELLSYVILKQCKFTTIRKGMFPKILGHVFAKTKPLR